MKLSQLLTTTALVMFGATSAFADCPVTQQETKAILRAYPSAQAAEKAGRNKEALALYVQAQGYTCDPNPNAAQAARRAAALALPLASAAEQKGDVAAAFELYEQGGHYAAADRALMALLRQNPDDVSLVTRYISHFRQRAEGSFASNQKDQIAATGGYSVDPALRAELEAMPAKGITRAMAKEATSFNEQYLTERVRLVQSRPEPSPANMAAMQTSMATEQAFRQKYANDPIKQSQDQLRMVRQWASLVPDDAVSRTTEAQTLARAEARATTLLTKYAGAPEFLEVAADYYRSVDFLKPAEARVTQIKAQASTLGDQARAKGRLTLAIEYYEVADEREKAEALRAQRQQQNMTQMQPQIDAARKAAEAMAAQYGDPAVIAAMKKQAEEARAAIEASKSKPSREKQKEKSALENELGIH